MMLKSVDLPQPDGPITATNSPCFTSSETLSSACTTPRSVSKRLVMRSTSSKGRAAAMAAGAASRSVTLTASPRPQPGARVIAADEAWS